jgi:macrolide transport system ATP-binding/permease protein
VENLIRDIRYAIRGLRRSPGFTLVAVATLALGIGVNATIFSMVSTVLFRPLPVEHPGELVNVYGHSETSSSHDAISYPNYLDYREQSETLDGVVAHTNFFANLSIDGSAELVVGEIVSDNFFQVLGVQPQFGRPFLPEETAAPGAAPVAVLSNAFWQTRFGADSNVLGRTFRMNGIGYTVVGVAPQGFGGMFPAATVQMWIPLGMVDEVEPLGNNRTSAREAGSVMDRRGRHFLWVKGRMRPGVEVEQVRAELQGIAARLARQYPEANERERVTVVRTNDVAINPDFDGTVAPAGMVLLAAVAVVLLVACANLANMLLARGATRRHEAAVRQAIGASRLRLIRSLMTESFVVALAGGAASLLLTVWLTGYLGRFQPGLPIDVGLEVRPDWRVMAFTFAAALGAGVAFGLVPAFRAARLDLIPALKDTGGEGSGRKRSLFELRDALVVSQVAFSLLLLVVGALMARSLSAAARVDLGYDAERVAYLSLALEMNGYDRESGAPLIEAGKQRLEAVPGVAAVGLASRLPQSLNNNGFGIYIDGHPSTEAGRPIGLDGAYVDEDYFAALELEILAGRAIDAADRDEHRSVAVVTQTMASRYYPGEPALGKTFRLSLESDPTEIVGIVEDYKVDTPGESPKPYIHLPLSRQPLFANFMVRTATPASSVVPTLEQQLRSLDPDLVFLETGTIGDLADVRMLPIRAGAWLIGTFGLLALVLAAVGLYGVIAFSVSRRLREIGIRKALGARHGSVLGLVLKRGMTLVAIGGVIGAVLAGAGARMLSGVLFVAAFDPLSFGAAFLVLTIVAGLANYIPARRAATVDPMVVLRGE